MRLADLRVKVGLIDRWLQKKHPLTVGTMAMPTLSMG
jgi:hypothetical protein